MKKKDDLLNSFNFYLKGNYPLKISFWGIYVFGWNVVLGFVLFGFLYSLGVSKTSGEIISYPITILLAIGVWNSAKNYKGKKIWSILSRTAVSIQVIAVILNIVLLIFGIDIDSW